MLIILGIPMERPCIRTVATVTQATMAILTSLNTTIIIIFSILLQVNKILFGQTANQ